MSYINSSNISIFPLAKNRPKDRSARIFYENNVANLIRQLIDVEGFLISDEESFNFNVNVDSAANPNVVRLTNTEQPIIFNLHGYYFHISAHTVLYEYDLPTTSETYDNGIKYAPVDLYAAIRVDNVTQEIDRADNNQNEYEGLEIIANLDSSKYSTVNGWHYLKLCTFVLKQDKVRGWIVDTTVNQQAYEKISPKSLDMSISRIDGKH